MSVGAVNKQTGERIPTAGLPAVDSVLSGVSTNPVQNRVVKEALDGKQDALTFDDTPTDNSNNPVKSNGIYDSEKDIYATMGEMGAKNLIPYPYVNTTKTIGSLSFTDNGDGTILVNGTNNSGENAFFNIQNTNIPIKKGKYVLSGTEAGKGTVRLYLRYTGDTGWIMSELGNKTPFEIETDTNITSIGIQVPNTYIINNQTIRPLLRLASDTDDTYQPYAKTNKQLTDDVALLDSKKADTDMVAADFNAGTSYTAGNYCVQDGKLYKFKNNHSGAWSSADVDEVKIAGELASLKSGLSNLSPRSLSIQDVVAGWSARLGDNFNLVMLVIENNIQDSDIVNGHTIISGLPPARTAFYMNVGTDKGVTIPCVVDGAGNLKVYYPNGTYSGTYRIDATIIYYATDTNNS